MDNEELNKMYDDAFNTGTGFVVVNKDGVNHIPVDKVHKDIGETSDGYHTFNELYEHRAVLFLALLSETKEETFWSFKHSDGTMYDNYIIAGIKTPEGWCTYHMKDTYLKYLDPSQQLEYAPVWDGHTSEDVLERLLNYFCKH